MCSTRREEVERKQEEWRKAIEERGLTIRRPSSSEQQDLVMWLDGEEVKRVKTLQYLGSTLAEDGELDAEVNQFRAGGGTGSVWGAV